MPAPLNILNREYAQDTRAPAASFMRALSKIYATFAKLEEGAGGTTPLPPEQTLNAAAKEIGKARTAMEGLTDVRRHWSVLHPELFSALMQKFTLLTGEVPVGDRSMIDLILRELTSLEAILKEAGPFPALPEDQAYFFSRIIEKVVALQQVLLIATQISIVTRQAD